MSEPGSISRRAVLAAPGALYATTGEALGAALAAWALEDAAAEEQAGRIELAVTALGDFAYCPMLYRWRYDLRVPQATESPARSEGDRPRAAGSLDAATLGTLFHRCMELLDFARPQPAESLLAQAAAELGLEGSADSAALAADLDEMLRRLRAHPLWADLAGAKQSFRELDFLMDAGPAVLRGQIDLLYQDAAGNWRIVDYKSDRVAAAEIETHAGRYELQMLAYAVAAARHVGRPPAGATLYFLRPGACCELPLGSDAVASAERRIADLAGRVIKARRSGTFERQASGRCAGCPCEGLCGIA